MCICSSGRIVFYKTYVLVTEYSYYIFNLSFEMTLKLFSLLFLERVIGLQVKFAYYGTH